ncbi:MAG: hypothetical protein KOO63_12385 [Bacteroidales bacterium]|nr:hypothetical protein [Candidatus Latescibacterota bacterium]
MTIRSDETSRVGFFLEYDCPDCPDGELIVSALHEADGRPGVSVRIFDMETGSTIAEGITDNTGQAIFSLESGEYGAEITLPEGFGLSPGQDNPVEHIRIFNGLSTRVNFHLWDSSVPQPDGVLMICVFSDSHADSIPGDPPEDFDVDVTVFDAAMNICATGTVQSNLCISFDLELGIYSVEVTVPSGYDLIRGENPIEAIEVVPNSTSHVTFVFRKPE